MASSATAVAELPAVLTAWSSFPDMLGQMNETVIATKQQREQSLQARKALADTTKQFKRSVKTAETAAHGLGGAGSSSGGSSAMDPAASLAVTSMDALSKECRVTIKSYQEEIDNLTRRCKSAETAYANVVAALVELPDPAAALQAALREIEQQKQQLQQVLQTVDTVNQELEQAEAKNREYQEQVKEMKAEKSSNNNNNNSSTTSSHSGGSGALTNEERDELVQLRTEVAEYEVEFRSLKNQDITIRKLEDKIYELQTAGADQLEQSIQQAREELAITEGRRASQALEREAATKAKVETLELQLRSERAGREATQNVMLEADEGLSRREAAWEAQRQILVDDNERVREELQTVSRERDELRMQVAALTDDGGGGGASPTAAAAPLLLSRTTTAEVQDLLLERNAYEAEVAELSETNKLLREEIRLKEEQIVEEKRKDQARIDALEREKSSLNTNLASLESQLSAAPSQTLVDNMKRELRILKRLEYNADDVDTDRDPEIARGADDGEKDLEAVLVAKLRRAESELVSERNSKTELMKTNEALKQSLELAEKAKQDAEALISSLENDLERAIATPVEKPTKKQSALPPRENPETLEHILDPSAPPTSNRRASAPIPSTVASNEKAQDDHSVATIVMAQRDRLRARCEALEAERDSFKRELQGQVQAAESLKSDNTKLYEKVRYLQNYNKSAGSKNRSFHRQGSSVLDRDLDLEALEQRYEASVDPFKQFSKSERQRKLGEMSPMERTVFMVAKTVLSTKEMRTGLFFYVVALHLLVFVTTYHWSHAGAECYSMHDHEQLSHLPPVLPAHIQEKMKAADALADAAGGE